MMEYEVGQMYFIEIKSGKSEEWRRYYRPFRIYVFAVFYGFMALVKIKLYRWSLDLDTRVDLRVVKIGQSNKQGRC